MAIILDPKTGDAWDVIDGNWIKVREGRPMLMRPLYRANGGETPTHCQNSDCNASFEGAAFRGKSGKLYCTRHCRDEMSDSYTPEELARMIN